MGRAFGAMHLGAPHKQAAVLMGAHRLFRRRLVEAGPTGARVELGAGVEQRLAATDAFVHAIVVVVPVLAGEGAFGAVLAGHAVLLRRQLLAPLLIRLAGSGGLKGRLAVHVGFSLSCRPDMGRAADHCITQVRETRRAAITIPSRGTLGTASRRWSPAAVS